MKTQGHTWNGPAVVRPRLVTTVAVEGPRGGAIQHYTNTHWVLDYALDRNGWVRAGSSRAAWRERTARSAHVYPPGTPYWEDTTRDAAPVLRSAFILFEGGSEAGLERLIRTPFGYARLEDPAGELQGLLLSLAAVGQRRGEAGFWEAQGLFCRVLDVVAQARLQHDEYYLLPGAAVAEPLSFAAQVDAFLRTHLAEPVSLARVAAHLHVSLSTLAHRYRAEAGISPAARLIGLRINLARGLLLSGQRLDQVAAQTGFCDAFHLSKTFKRQVGLAPRAFLAQARKDVNSRST